MARLQIRSQFELTLWLRTQSDQIAAIISARAAIRCAFYQISPQFDYETNAQLFLANLRCVFFSWAIHSEIGPVMSRAAGRAIDAADETWEAMDWVNLTPPLGPAYAFNHALKVAEIAKGAAEASARLAEVLTLPNQQSDRWRTQAAQAFVALSREKWSEWPGSDITVTDLEFFREYEGKDAWIEIAEDCRFFEIGHDTSQPSYLKSARLWRRAPSELQTEFAEKASRYLCDADPHWQVWIDWLQRRWRGGSQSFDIPGDSDRREDQTLLRRLAEATDADFWDKGHEFVNAELTRWLDEARARAALPPISAQAHGTLELTGSGTMELGPVPLPRQNRNVLSFRATPEGRIAIDASALADRMRNDQGAQDRYAEAVGEAQMILDHCQRSNAGARLTRLLENYLAATGLALAEAKPSLLVQRGERLRQELQTYETPDSFLPPISDDLLNDLIGWRTAHNMMVALDPVLNAADLAMLGPDRQPVPIPREEIEQQVRQADAAGLIEANEAEIILEGIGLAPQRPDLSNRRTLWSVEVIRNLFTESVGIALNPSNADAQATAIILKSGLRAFCGSIDHAKYIVEHREWILSRLGSTPAWQDVITRLVDRLEAITPYQRK